METIQNLNVKVERNEEGDIIGPLKWPRYLEAGSYGLKDETQESLILRLYEQNPTHSISCEGAARAVLLFSGVQIKRPNLEKFFDRVFVKTGKLHKLGLIIDGSPAYKLNTEVEYCLNCWTEDYQHNMEVYVWEKEDHLKRFHHYNRKLDFAFGHVDMSFTKEKPKPKTQTHRWILVEADAEHGTVKRRCTDCETIDTAYFNHKDNDCGAELEKEWDRRRSERVDKICELEQNDREAYKALLEGA